MSKYIIIVGILLSGCQKSDLQACADAHTEYLKSEPKKEDGSWNAYWEGGHFDEAHARSAAFSTCAREISGN